MELSAPSMKASMSASPNRRPRLVRNHPKAFPSQMPGNQGLGPYEYRMLNVFGNHDGSMQSLPQPTIAPEFSDSSIYHRKSSKSPPNILSAEYDPFAPFHSDIGSSYTSVQFSRRSTEMSLPPKSPPHSAVASHRSSLSSTSETYSNPESYSTLPPSVKMENRLDWLPVSSTCPAITAPQTDYSILANSSSYPVTLGDTFFREQGGGSVGWPQVSVVDMPNNHTTLGQATIDETFRCQERERKGPLGNMARTRTPRKMTTREDANYQCKVKGCGKLFSRSYNFKAHMDTHDSSRVYPFPCPLPECNKKFVRKTDLQRHHQSVHMKERNFRCDFCSRYFARKDTLRRHMEDGCSKRFDLALGYSQYGGTVQEELRNTTRPTSLPSSYSTTSTMYPPTNNQPSATFPAIYSGGASFLDGENTRIQLWSD